MKRIHLYFRKPPEKDRYFPGDRYIFSAARKLLRPKKISGIEKVFINLRLGFDEIGVNYVVNRPFKEIAPGEPVVVLGIGKQALEGYNKPNPIIAGIALVSHPTQWLTMCQDFSIVKYLQHSKWANDIYIPYYGAEVCELWPAGIETQKWLPEKDKKPVYDVLIYNKIRWNHAEMEAELVEPVKNKLKELGLSFTEIIYGHYQEADYHKLLKLCRSMVFLCEHESQGFACCEALSMDIPVYAWDQNFCLDPERDKWGTPDIPASSVPFFDDTCGMKFKNYAAFETGFDAFWEKVTQQQFTPRDYILKNITLEKSARRMLEIIQEVYD
ncbi:glycosyltransferase [Mucilaginibacter kameinonensis]|uniref:glycosyltransferase n=1 Tax=Mucilaginibacter kameinonensis TaxID=452286 RepID=UPI000EF7CA84|nr:glycosyltransferase [Mucilaginibacter kameinonensis]